MKRIIILICLLKLTVSCDMIAAGSYPYAERYDINLSEKEIIKRVEEFKKKYPEYAIPKTMKYINGRRNEKDHWYNVYFYDRKHNKIIKTWIRGPVLGEKTTTFAFVAVLDNYNLSKSKLINREYSSSENKKVIKYFEENILYKLGINEFIEK